MEWVLVEQKMRIAGLVANIIEGGRLGEQGFTPYGQGSCVETRDERISQEGETLDHQRQALGGGGEDKKRGER